MDHLLIKSLKFKISGTLPWIKLKDWQHLIELDLVSMRFANIQSLLKVVGPQLESLTLEVDEEQGKGSELVFIGKVSNKMSIVPIFGHKH